MSVPLVPLVEISMSGGPELLPFANLFETVGGSDPFAAELPTSAVASDAPGTGSTA